MEFAAEQFGGRMVLTCSWQLGTSILVHMTREVAPQTRLVEIDTGLLFAETHATRQRLVDHYGLEVETLRPLQSVEEQAAAHGAALWEREPDRCCGLRKVEPLERAIRDADGWLTGIRRDQTEQRARAPKLVLDARRGVVKVQPLVDWSERDCWRYIHRTASRTTSCTTAASRRSAARRARARPAAARTRAPAAGPAAARPSAACTSPETARRLPLGSPPPIRGTSAITCRLSLVEVDRPSTGVARPDMKRRLDSIIIGGAMLFGGMAHRRAEHVSRQVDELGEAIEAVEDQLRQAEERAVAAARPRHAAADRLRPAGARPRRREHRPARLPPAGLRAGLDGALPGVPAARPAGARGGVRTRRLQPAPEPAPAARRGRRRRIRERLSGTLQYVFGNDPGFSVDETFGGTVAADAPAPRRAAGIETHHL